MVYRSDLPLPKIFQALHLTPSSHQPAIESHPDPTDLETLSDVDSDDNATIAEDMKCKSGTSSPLIRRGVLKQRLRLVVPKKPKITVRKRKASGDIR